MRKQHANKSGRPLSVEKKTKKTSNAPTRRTGDETKQSLLTAAEEEFSRHGLAGARVERIAVASGVDIRMFYRHFRSKEDLYTSVLERMYVHYRHAEKSLELRRLPPVQGMIRLVEFTFDNLGRNPSFVRLVMGENLLDGAYLKRSKVVPEVTVPMLEIIGDLLRRGEKEGVFRSGVDPFQLYVTILAVGFFHIGSRSTLSIMFKRDVSDPKWLSIRRKHVIDVVLGCIHSGG